MTVLVRVIDRAFQLVLSLLMVLVKPLLMVWEMVLQKETRQAFQLVLL